MATIAVSRAPAGTGGTPEEGGGAEDQARRQRKARQGAGAADEG